MLGKRKIDYFADEVFEAHCCSCYQIDDLFCFNQMEC